LFWGFPKGSHVITISPDLLFVLELCHYYFTSTVLLPFCTLATTLGPHASLCTRTPISYGRYGPCHFDTISWV
jgi:hypothetical protein